MSNLKYSKFSSVIKVRPDDIDMFNHVHSSKYLDYVLAARYDQMEKYYLMSMEEFKALGFGWVIKTFIINYKRPLVVNDEILVTTQILSIDRSSCKVNFSIINNSNKKLCADGIIDFIMIDIKNGKSTNLNQEIIKKYSI